jgi:uncharacterized protein (TIGR02246 family)
MTQTSDDQAIRNVVSEWVAASRRGDTQAVLELMTDDALFLVPGQPPMDKAGFANASRATPGARPALDIVSDIREIQVDRDMAWMWSRLAVTMTPPDAPPVRREGHTLTIFRRVQGKWLLARDANLLVKV